jgi:hypothetical protein
MDDAHCGATKENQEPGTSLHGARQRFFFALFVRFKV